MMITSDREAFSIPRLKALAERHAVAYRQAKPFPHIAVDDFVDPEVLLPAARAFPTNGELQMYRYDNPLERKLAFDQVARLPRPLADVLHAMNSPAILKFMEWLTGIDKLIPDPYYRGGGIHQVPPGGKLDIHRAGTSRSPSSRRSPSSPSGRSALGSSGFRGGASTRTIAIEAHPSRRWARTCSLTR